jgi:hypothetical protein
MEPEIVAAISMATLAVVSGGIIYATYRVVKSKPQQAEPTFVGEAEYRTRQPVETETVEETAEVETTQPVEEVEAESQPQPQSVPAKMPVFKGSKVKQKNQRAAWIRENQ